ncbi:MAG: MurT ligase domain-containing protein [Lachnospiraceae bacterium]|jgi:UDP-N-acetylmuramoylalanine-D-glutamate ligase|nr:MurT ligase domain-containing protein [Lachnospiraceae bacterium]
MKFYLVLWICKFISEIVNIIDNTRGTKLAGEIACKLYGDEFIGKFKNINPEKTVFVTGTNGKSTTNNIITHTLRMSGKTVASNLEGANLITGVATTLIKNSLYFGKFKKEFLVLEVDERSLVRVCKHLQPNNLCITNIQKDQMQRNAEPDIIYQVIKSIIHEDLTIYVNNQEPRGKSLEQFVSKVIYFGMEKNEKSFVKDGFYDITMPCPICNNRLKFNYYNIDNVGDYECESCGFKPKEDVEYAAKNINYENNEFMVDNVTYKVPYSEPHFIYDFMAAIVVCKNLGVEDISEAFVNFKNVGGRTGTIKYGSKELKYLKVKTENPETFQSTIDSIIADKTNKIVVLALEELAEFFPPFTNTFYAYDCSFDKLKDANIERYICSSRAVAYDSANILKYAGVPKEKITVVPTDDDGAIVKELNKYDIDNIYLITWSGKYKRLSKYIKEMPKQYEEEK